ncbi:MAG: PDZ domain-containing protein [Candidatus Aminicenantes bacterium]|nr:PDZ domain-containing protein [Candidatus Aminicenantes bacterium]
MKSLVTWLIAAVLFQVAPATASQESRLLRDPDISDTQIVFTHGGDLWVVARTGGDARRLTAFPGVENNPHFSPDGQLAAFSAAYDGNTDVYVVSASGGEPRRLTWHPEEDIVRGWTPDGSRVLFASGRASAPIAYPKFWTVALTGGQPQPLPIPRVFKGSYSPDGARLAYQMIEPWESEFRNYRGGQNNPIRIVDLASFEEEKLPWDGSNDNSPVWLGNTVYFLSDRDYAMNVWDYDLSTKSVRQLTHFSDYDAKQIAGHKGTLVIEQGGCLHTLDIASGELKKLDITVQGDFPWARPHWSKVGEKLTEPALSSSGKRAVFAARGEIVSIPAEKGDARNLSRNPGAADRSPAWSPNGEKISWFSDASGEYALVIADQQGENRKVIRLPHPTFFYSPVWSPDSSAIAFSDANRDLWLVHVASETIKRIDTEGFAHPERIIYPCWSPDSKWIAYAKRLRNEYGAIFVYSLDKGTTAQLTDGMSDSRMPAWDASGKYLYFLASTDYGLNVGWLDLSSYQRPITRSLYAIVLAKDTPTPLGLESDEETAKKPEKEDKGKAGDKESGKDKAVPPMKIDFDGLQGRIVAFPIKARDYRQLVSGEEGTLFLSEAVLNEEGLVLHRWITKERKSKEFLSGLSDFSVSADGKKILYGLGGKSWGIVDASGTPKPGDGKIASDELQIFVDPAAEWRQIFKEAWRFQRDYFYVRNVHGVDLDWLYQTYAPWIEHVKHRADLNYVLDILGGETSIGHSFVGGGDLPKLEPVPVGLLGADFSVDSGRYKILKIYTGESWNPDLKAPLAGPGIDIKEGEYLVAVNGRELDAGLNPYSLFERTAGVQTRIKVNAKPSLEGAREITVVPVRSEEALRRCEWIEHNRRRVNELSGGKLAYVWLPDTADGAYVNFNRYFFAQKDKKGAIVDERFNQGGSIADYIIDLLARPLLGYFNNPLGDKQPWTAPNAAIFGPKVMIINDAAGSGGDMMPYMFKLRGIGPLVGTRTWGGLVGIWDVPSLIDGGRITSPRGGFYNINGEWDVENKGVAPDIEVEMEVKSVNAGGDPQLEKAVEAAMQALKTGEVKLLPQPPDPVRVRRPHR